MIQPTAKHNFYPMPGRTFNGEKFRLGFNGQEKVNEINGTGNHYTAQFWEYDPRLGRRWNMDPVRKPWQSPYATFSGNPIWKMDPNGDDDYFNSKGKLIYRTNAGHNIYVRTLRGYYSPLNKLNTNDIYDKMLLSTIATHYGQQIGINYVGVKDNPEGKKALGNPAFTEKFKNVYMNTNGVLGESMNDYNNLKNLLIHEKIHTEQSEVEEYTGQHEVLAYTGMIKDKTWANTTDKYQKEVLDYVSSDLLRNVYEKRSLQGGMQDEDFQKFLDDNFKNTGYKATFKRTSMGKEDYTIEIQKNNTTKEQK